MTNPNGGVVFSNNGGFQPVLSQVTTTPPMIVAQPGPWRVEAQYYIELYGPDDWYDDYDDYLGYGYADPDGYWDYGVQTCDSACELYGSGYFEVLNGYWFQFAGSSASVYIDPVTVQVSPTALTLDGGEQWTFAADVASIPAGGNTGVTWAISSLAGGTWSSTSSGYTYIAPMIISSTQNLTLKACSTVVPTACDSVTITLLVPTISLAPPSPSVLLADGHSTSYLNAYITNGPANPSVDWTPPANVLPTGAETATYTAPASGVIFGTDGTAPIAITATIHDSNPADPAIKASTTLTLVQPVSIANVLPTTWTAGTTIPTVTINGGGFGTNATVSFGSTSWGAVTNGTCAPTNTTITCMNVSIPLNLSNIPSQPITITVSTPSSLIPTSSSISQTITPVVYTYSLSLQATSPSLTYGYQTPITPTATCKVGSATCSTGIFNPQTAEVDYTIKSGFGTLSNSSGNSITYTDNELIGYPGQNVVVQGCLAISPTTCGTANISIQPTVITLSPATLNNPLTGGGYQSFNANIQNPGMANQLTWTLSPSPSGAAAGTMISGTTTFTGSPTSGASSNTFTAPNPIAVLTTSTLTACMTANPSICATPVSITLWPPPTFSVTATPIPGSQPGLSLGHTMAYTVTVTPLYGFTGTVTLSVGGLPAGVTAQLSAPYINTAGTATLTLTSAYSASTYRGQSAVTITGTSGGLANPGSFTLTTRALQYPCM